MSQGRLSTRLLVAAISTLLTGSLVGSSGLVLCIGADGHRAIEREHEAIGCPTLASAQPDVSVSIATSEVCFDLPAGGGSPVARSSADDDGAPSIALLALQAYPAPRIETPLLAATDAPAVPRSTAPHLRSTVLRV